jgi:hypothetical protein
MSFVINYNTDLTVLSSQAGMVSIINSILQRETLVTKQLIILFDLQAASYLERSMSKSAIHFLNSWFRTS